MPVRLTWTRWDVVAECAPPAGQAIDNYVGGCRSFTATNLEDVFPNAIVSGGGAADWISRMGRRMGWGIGLVLKTWPAITLRENVREGPIKVSVPINDGRITVEVRSRGWRIMRLSNDG